MIKGFKDFLMRGNVVDLAVAVVIGAAFTAVVTAFVSALIKPLINAFPGASSNGWGFSVRHTAGVPHGSTADVLGKNTFIDISAVINAVIIFLITAAVVYFVFVLPLKKLDELRKRRMAAGQPAEEASVPSDELIALHEIRDLLKAQRPTA